MGSSRVFFTTLLKIQDLAKSQRTSGTTKYSSIDDKIDDFHWYTTFIKLELEEQLTILSRSKK